MPSPNSVRQYFKAKSVLVTGVTGLFGRYVVAKLLKNCEIDSLFVVLRPRRNNSIEQRLESLLRTEIFKGIDSKILRQKIIPIKGDVALRRFGITDKDFERLKQCDIFIHMAADVRLNRSLIQSVLANTKTTQNAIQVVQQLRNVKKYAHISTTYVFDERPSSTLEERVHEYPFSAPEITEIVDCFHNNTELSAKHKQIFDSKSSFNNYSMSKTLGEILVADNSKDVDTIIFRPSVIMPAMQDPYVGWFTGNQIINNMAIPMSTGLWQVQCFTEDSAMSTIPVDVCGNALLKAISMENSTRQLAVFNGAVEYTQLIPILELLNRLSVSHPIHDQIRPVMTDLSAPEDNSTVELKRFLYETLYANYMDLVYMSSGRKALLRRDVKRMHNFLDSIRQVIASAKCKHDKLPELWNKCCEEDKKLFNFNPSAVDYYEILTKFYLKLREQMDRKKYLE